MPSYDLEHFKQLVSEGEWSYLNERRAHKNRDKLEWSDGQVAEVLLGLDVERNFQHSAPNCKVNDFPQQDYIDADQYEIHWHVEEKVGKRNPQDGTISLSIKIAIAEDREGVFAGIVTFHTSPEP